MRFPYFAWCAVGASLMLGCGPQTKPNPAPATKVAPEEKPHAHGAGPHGGTIGDLGGGKYHFEFTVDHDKKLATIYILGGDEKTSSPIKAERLQLHIDSPATDIELAAKPPEGEPAGSTSRFEGTHDVLGKVQEFAGEVNVVVDGTPYSGKFAERP